MAERERQGTRDGEMNAPIEVETNRDGTVKVEIPLVGTASPTESTHGSRDAPQRGSCRQTVGTLDGVEYAVTGSTANSQDFNEATASSIADVFGFVLLFAFGLLLVTFRSIVIAIKAILLNLLSVAAAYGVLVAVFQWGWGEGLLDFHSNGGIANWLPMFMFVILFGLSMDYHVFILSRIREALRPRASPPTTRSRTASSRPPARSRAQRRDGRGLPRLHDAAARRPQGDGHRPRGRRPDRRHHRPRACCSPPR